MTKYVHIHPKFRPVLDLSVSERIEFMDQPRWIGYPLAKSILNTLHGLMEKPKQPRMPNLLLVGNSNNGKTTILKHFMNLYGQGTINEESEPVRPVWICEAPPSADEKGLYLSILEQSFSPYRATDPVTKLRYQVTHLLRYCHTSILIIDEFHSLLTGTPIKQREVMNAIKFLCNETAIPIVGVGTREAVRVLHTDPQHASRFDVLTLPLWDLNADFQKLLTGFEKLLPLKKPSHLFEPQLASKIHAISEGNLGNIHRLLVECAREAIENETEFINSSLVDSKAWLRPTRGIREVIL